MSVSILKVRNTEYRLDEVLLRIGLSKEGDDNFVTFDLFVDRRNASQPGFAINSMSIIGTQTNAIENMTFELDEDDDDPLNELRESVVCEPGAVLELSHLKIRFGAFQNGAVDTELEATCFQADEESSELSEADIPVFGKFTAKIQA